MNNIKELFKLEIYKQNLNLNIELLEKFCLKLQNNYESRKRSNIGGWQSDDLFYEKISLIQDFKDIITKHINKYALHFNFKRKIELSNLWVNINEYKDSNSIHLHPGAVFSGVFYIKSNENSGNLIFHNPCEDLMDIFFSDNVSKYNSTNSSEWFFKPEENNLILFPGYLKHSVGPNLNKKEKRISISFNAIIKQ